LGSASVQRSSSTGIRIISNEESKSISNRQRDAVAMISLEQGWWSCGDAGVRSRHASAAVTALQNDMLYFVKVFCELSSRLEGCSNKNDCIFRFFTICAPFFLQTVRLSTCE
jgi:hypothetical protein